MMTYRLVDIKEHDEHYWTTAVGADGEYHLVEKIRHIEAHQEWQKMYGPHPTSHRYTCMCRSGRHGSHMRANWEYNHVVDNEYPWRHKNRHADDVGYAFDDDVYCTAWHSTGWKYSTKKRHQYLVHVA